MQTFLPYPDFSSTARCLDRQRLGKQRVEVLQLLNAIGGATSGWTNHPAAKMWRGYEPALVHYGLAICREWADARGYRDTCADKIRASRWYSADEKIDLPPWIGAHEFHASHRSNLLRKNPGWYTQFAWPEPPDLPYVWPITTTTEPGHQR